ncbi:MAG: biotin/lipoyl-containing protein [Kiritimatiellia bacterium]
MITRVRVPTISTNVTEVTLTAWFKEEGEAVRKGEPLAEITTDKATVELECPRSGILRQKLAKTKSILPVGYIIALIGNNSDRLPDVSRENEQLLARYRTELGLPPQGSNQNCGEG